jgi:predicted dehydrogenase
MIFIREHRAPFLEKMEHWNKFSQYSGGTLVEKCCHYFDIFNLLAGASPVKVYASGGQDVAYRDFVYKDKKSDILDNAYTIVDYKGGIRACLDLCMFRPSGSREEIAITGTSANLYAYDYPDNKITIETGRDDYSRTITVDIPPEILGIGGHMGGTYFEHISFLDSIRDKRPPCTTVMDGFWSVVVGAAAERSVKTGQPVLIDDLLKENGINGQDFSANLSEDI